MKTGQDLISEAKAKVSALSVDEAKALHGTPGIVFLDVREPNEYNLGRIPGAVFIPRGQLETNIEARVPRATSIVVYCASDNRSALATAMLAELGYASARFMTGGFKGWAMAGNPVEG